MKYGAMNSPLEPIKDEIKAIAELGFDYLELTLDAPNAHYTLVLKEKNEIRSLLADQNLDLVCHLPTFVYTADLTPSIRKASVEEMIRSIETAAEIGANKAVLHPPYLSGLGGFVPELSMEYAYESLEKITGAGSSAGITLCAENMPPDCGIFYKPDEFEGLFRRFPELHFTFDTGHANIGGDPKSRKAIGFIERYGDRLEHLHVSDNRGRSDDHLPPGAGRIDFKAIIKALKKIGFDGTATFEIFTPDRNYLRWGRDRFKSLWEKY